MAKSNSPKNYGNDSISSLKGADRVRKRPAVIFGSDGLEGCEHAVFEILSNAIDEAREGHGSLITVTRYEDHSIEVEDFGRGCPVDWNEKEQKFNWELVFCELYAGGKYGGDGYNNNDGDNYEYSLGLNGLGSCATQYASAYFDAVIHRDGFEYTLHFEKGENVGGLKKEPYSGKKTGSRFRWKPDLDVFTDINIPVEYYTDVLKRQAVVNAGVTFRFRNQVGGKFETTDFQYENGIEDYVKELAGENSLTLPVFWQTERRGRDRADKPEDKVKLFPRECQDLVEAIQARILRESGKHVEVMVYGDGAFKDPVGKIWELADPVVSPAYTAGLEGTPNELKLKYLADNDFAALSGEALRDAIKDEIKKKDGSLVGKMAAQGTTPRRLTDLIGSLCDLTSGSGDKGTPIVYIQGYFDNYTTE